MRHSKTLIHKVLLIYNTFYKWGGNGIMPKVIWNLKPFQVKLLPHIYSHGM